MKREADPVPSSVLLVLLKEYGSLCERCLANCVGMTIKGVAAALKSIRRSIALPVELAECPRCREFTKIFALAKRPGDTADTAVVKRTEPAVLRQRDDPVCLVCLTTIEAKHSVAIDHGVVVHADCWGKPPARRVASYRGPA